MQTRTRRQREVLDFITHYIERHGHAPSYQTVARHLGVASKTAIGKHIRALEDQGLLHRARSGRSFRLLLGRAKKADAPENAIEWLKEPVGGDGTEASPFSIPDFILGEREADDILAFRVPDDGMAEKSIREGDIVLAERRSYGRDGDCLVVTINGGETILRRFYRAGADIELRASSDDFPVLRLSADQIEIHGVYRGLLRPID